MKKFTARRHNNIRFIFAMEPPEYELLHIYARHLTDEKDAIHAFLYGVSKWNKKHRRWETTDRKHTIYWNWITVNKKVVIITCFTNNHII